MEACAHFSSMYTTWEPNVWAKTSYTRATFCSCHILSWRETQDAYLVCISLACKFWEHNSPFSFLPKHKTRKQMFLLEWCLFRFPHFSGANLQGLGSSSPLGFRHSENHTQALWQMFIGINAILLQSRSVLALFTPSKCEEQVCAVIFTQANVVVCLQKKFFFRFILIIWKAELEGGGGWRERTSVYLWVIPQMARTCQTEQG